MTRKPNDPLLKAGQIITVIMQVLMGIAGAALVFAIPVLLFAQDSVNAELREEFGQAAEALPILPVIGVLLLALVVVALVFLFFGKLRHIIATVGEGDPFVPANADRLTAMAWLMLGVQLIGIPIIAIGAIVADWADQFEKAQFTVDAGIDLTGILMAIVLFILARVFRHGADMRAELEGTV